MEIFPQLIVNSLISTALYALIALPFGLLYNTNKFFDLSFGGVAIVAGYSVFYFAGVAQMPVIVAVLIAMAVAIGVALACYRGIYLPLRKRKAKNLVLLIATLGVSIVIEAVLAMLFTSRFQDPSRYLGEVKTFSVLGGTFTALHAWLFVGVIVIALLLYWFLSRTKFGKAVKAVADDEEVARTIGIPTRKVILLVVAIAAAIGALAGIASGFDTGLLPTLGLRLLLKGIIAAIIGGSNTVFGPLAGAAILGFAENMGIAVIPGEWKDAIAFGLLILFLIFRPKGLFKG